MRRNPERRQALIDAAIEVLAREGARGLTFRAVDTEAAVPPGTASNYFANRDDLFTQVGGRIYERLLPDEATIARSQEGVQDETRYAELMHELVDRVSAFNSGYLALLELRLESTRRPELRAVLTKRIREDIDANIGYHATSGLPRRLDLGGAPLSHPELADRGAADTARHLHRAGDPRAGRRRRAKISECLTCRATRRSWETKPPDVTGRFREIGSGQPSDCAPMAWLRLRSRRMRSCIERYALSCL
ncbi:hypothetical protein GCM10020219_061690 [Nonomuraea dietziae]